MDERLTKLDCADAMEERFIDFAARCGEVVDKTSPMYDAARSGLRRMGRSIATSFRMSCRGSS